MLGAVYFDNQLCARTVKVHNEFADDSLFVNFYRIFAEKKIPELALMGSHFSAKPPGIFQLAVVLWYGHVFPLSRLRRQLSQRESQVPRATYYTERCYDHRSFRQRIFAFILSGSCTPHICGNVLPRAGRGTGTPGGWGCPGKTPAPRQSPGFCRRARQAPRRYSPS